ncbi:MAG TPA: outer membrane beta-barrel protein [Geobacteraceae bacterium]|nr:outer membrane beta-barrel protein [Geobacteraceae bacterium]
MKSYFCMACVAALLTLSAGSAMADSIRGRLGVTGRLGFIVPSESSGVATGLIGTNTEFIAGGGFIYGVTDAVAAELDITHAGFSNSDITNISLGGQYRFTMLPMKELVPYAGAGLDILLIGSDFGNVDDTVGAHLSAGVDYFIQKQLAVTAEMKGVLAPNTDIKFGGVKRGEFDPTSFSMTFGVRYFFN